MQQCRKAYKTVSLAFSINSYGKLMILAFFFLYNEGFFKTKLKFKSRVWVRIRA